MNKQIKKDTYTRKRERKTNRLNMRVSDSEMAVLNRLSYEDDEPVSQIIRKAIKSYINDRAEN